MLFRERLTGGITLVDGAMGTLLLEHLREHDPAQLSRPLEYLNVADPQHVLSIHLAYLEAGAEVITTNTFCANAAFLSRYSLSGEVTAINLAAVLLAHEAIRQFGSPSPRFIAGSIGPIQSDSAVPDSAITAAYHSQAHALIEGEVDCLLLETFPSIWQAEQGLAAVCQARREANRDMPIVLSFAPTKALVPLGAEHWRETCHRLSDIGVDYFGANCGDDPAAFRSLLGALSSGVDRPIFAIPSAGAPRLAAQSIQYPLSPVLFAQYVLQLLETIPLIAVGGCCGTTPEHIRILRESIRCEGDLFCGH